MHRYILMKLLNFGLFTAILFSCETVEDTPAPAAGGGPFEITITTTAVTGITSSWATSGGSVTTNGNGTVVAKGVCWSTLQNPTIDGASVMSGVGTGVFTSQMTGLENNKVYYVRSYATDNENQTVYGNQVNFTTSSADIFIITNPAFGITSSTAYVGGMVDDMSGGYLIVGLCWSASPNPTLADYTLQLISNHTSGPVNDGELTGLTPGIKYYARLYATDNTGATNYGNVISFTTTGGSGGGGGGGTTTSSLDGKWLRSGDNDFLIVNTTTGTGIWELATFTPSAEYMVLVSNGQATLSTPHLKNIVKTSATTWTCQRFTFTFQGSGSSATITNVNYIPATITLSSDGKTFTLVGTVSAGLGYPSNWVGQTLTSTFTRQ
jgi:hypothetical protein